MLHVAELRAADLRYISIVIRRYLLTTSLTACTVLAVGASPTHVSGQTMDPDPGPYVQLVGTIAITGQTAAFTGDMVTVYGSNFCGTPGCSPVTVTVVDRVVRAERVAASGVQVTGDGRFQTTFTVTEDPGQYTVTASQTAADGSTLTDLAPLTVALGDLIPEQPPIR